ncbi:PBS lyase HEAT-like repeat protein [Gimesia alba]|uniref:PBS lyase HEAT-like repeat protein n=2 Tax=Gimesia alba TaxID=2527973 RepID=A0A517RDJ8_9PLAN|nr:PBS lyase HEAT-like repeat protein [Gimesia alba]
MPVRLDIIRALADIGPKAAAAVPTLKRFLASDVLMDNENREQESRTSGLWEGIHEVEIVKVWAAAALVKIVPNQPEAKAGFDFLVRKVREGPTNNTQAQSEAVEALSVIGNDAAIAVLIQALEIEDKSEWGTFRETVLKALGGIGPSAKAAIPALRKALIEKNPNRFGVPREAARALGEMGASAQIAIPDLDKLRASDDMWLREIAENAIRKLSTDKKKTNVTKE